MTSLPELRGVMLEDSWVLGWSHEQGRVVFRLDASLWSQHPDYETPRPGEWTCYKPAILSFEGVESVIGLRSMAETPSSTDPNGSKDYGNIESLTASEHGYLIAGDFGEVTIKAKECRFLLT